MKKSGILIGLLVMLSTFNVALVQAQETLLFEGYLNKGESVMVGPLVVTLVDVRKNYLNNTYQAVIAVTRDGKLLNEVASPVIKPNKKAIQELLSKEEFWQAAGISQQDFEALSEEEQFGIIMETIKKNSSLGYTARDLVNVDIDFNTLGENQTLELEVDGEKVAITVLEVYPNGAKLSISGPSRWATSRIPAYITTSVEAPKTVNPGEEFVVKVHLKNEGAVKARYITVIVSPVQMNINTERGSSSEGIAQALGQSGVLQSQFLPVNTTMKYIEYLEGKEEKTVEFRFKVNENAVPGTYPIYVTVIYSWGTGQGLTQMQSFNFVGITIAKESEATFVIEGIEKPKVVHPGDDFEVKIKLRNLGGEEAKDVLAVLEPNAVLGTSEGSSKLPGISLEKAILIGNASNQYYKAIVTPKGELEYTFRLHVSENAKTGSYPLTLKLTYYSGDAKESKSQNFEFSIQVLERKKAFIEIESIEIEPRKIEPGDEFTLKVKVKNVGEETAKAFEFKILPYTTKVQGEIKNVDLSSLQNLPIQGGQAMSENLQTALNQIMKELAKKNIDAFLPIGEDNVRYVNEIKPGQEITFELHLKAHDDLENGIYPLRIGLDYLSEPNDEKISHEMLVGIDVLGKEMLIVSKVLTSPSKVRPDTDNVEVSLEVENIGTGTAKYVVFKPKPQYPFELSDTSEQVFNLGTLKQGDSAKVVFRVDVEKNATEGTYEIPAEVTYKDPTGKVKTITLKIPIIIHAKPELKVEGVRFDKTPMQGEDVKVYIKVKNVGGEKAKDVIIEGVVKTNQPFTLETRTDYIGTLEPGDVGEGVLELSIDRDAVPKEHNILIRIRAVGDPDEGDDNVYVFDEYITIPVEENVKQRSALRVIGAIVGVLVILAVVGTYRRKKRQQLRVEKQ